MHRPSTVLAILALAATVVFVLSAEMYTSQFDHIDIDEILKSARARKQYIDCYLGDTPCKTADAKFLKEKLGEAIVTNCRKCTEKQKEFFGKAIDWFTTNDPETWQMVLKRTLGNSEKQRA